MRTGSKWAGQLQMPTDQQRLLTSKCPSGSLLFAHWFTFVFCFFFCNVDPRPVGPKGWRCALLLTSSLTHQKGVHQLITPSLNNYYKTPHCLPQVGTLGFEGISPLCPPLPGKAIKLSFSTSPVPKLCPRDLTQHQHWGTEKLNFSHHPEETEGRN